MHEKSWFFCSNFPSPNSSNIWFIIFFFLLFCRNEIEVPKFKSLPDFRPKLLNYRRSLFSSSSTIVNKR